MKPKITTTPEGRVFASLPGAEGARELVYPLPGVAGELLDGAGYRARVVVERVDGGGIGDTGRAFVDGVMSTATELGTHAPEVRERAATAHFAKARERIAAKRPKRAAP